MILAVIQIEPTGTGSLWGAVILATNQIVGRYESYGIIAAIGNLSLVSLVPCEVCVPLPVNSYAGNSQTLNAKGIPYPSPGFSQPRDLNTVIRRTLEGFCIPGCHLPNRNRTQRLQRCFTIPNPIPGVSRSALQPRAELRDTFGIETSKRGQVLYGMQ